MKNIVIGKQRDIHSEDAAPDKEAVDDIENACVRLRVYGKRRADDEPE